MNILNDNTKFLFVEPNLEEFPTLLNEIFRFEYYITKKEDGVHVSFILLNTDQRFIFDKNGPTVNSAINEVEKKYNVFENLKNYFNLSEDFILQGEVLGPDIKGNKYNLQSHVLYIHSIFHINTNSYYPFVTLRDFSNKTSIPMVQIIEMGDSCKYRLDDLQNLTNSLRSMDGSFAEGIIIRPQFPIFSTIANQPWSAKLLNKNYV